MSSHLVRKGDSSRPGLMPLMEEEALGLRLSLIELPEPGMSQMLEVGLECALVLLRGEARIRFSGETATVQRGSVFDDKPATLHLDAGTSAEITALGPCELALVQVRNCACFDPALLAGESALLETKAVGEGQLQGTAHRHVQLIFDGRNRPGANLVLGETVTLPGRWSSYPPHHHPQPEIYHYRFTRPEGFGHAELDEEVFKVHSGDTLMIPGGRTHAQAAAPGYGMYYLWAIRHLPGRPYQEPTFLPEHAWLTGENPPVWEPDRGELGESSPWRGEAR